MTRLAGKAAMITGAARGIGGATARLFAENGARVAVIDVAREDGEAVVREIRDRGGEAIFVEADVADPEAVAAAVSRSVEAFGGLDVVYNNAGGATAKDGKVTEIPLDEFWRTIGVDLFGTFLACRFAIPHLAAGGGGSIINTTSIRALVGTQGADAYTWRIWSARHEGAPVARSDRARRTSARRCRHRRDAAAGSCGRAYGAHDRRRYFRDTCCWCAHG